MKTYTIKLCGLMAGLLCLLASNFVSANHCDGLSLQLPGTTINIKTSDIDQAQAFKTSQDYLSIMLKLKPKLATQLTKLTEKEIGNTALWIWNSRVLSIEKLTAPIGKDLTVHHFKSSEADEFYHHCAHEAVLFYYDNVMPEKSGASH